MEYQAGKYVKAAARNEDWYLAKLARERDRDKKLKHVRELPTEDTVEELYREVYGDENGD